MNFNYLCRFICSTWIFITPIFALAQQIKVISTIPMSGSLSLIVTFKVERIPNGGTITQLASPGVEERVLHATMETYVVALRVGDVQVNLDQVHIPTVEGLEASVNPNFAVYDAVLDGKYLHYFFISGGKPLLGTAHVNGAGAVSGFHKIPFPGGYTDLDDAKFVRDKSGRVILQVTNRKGFRFDDSGEPFSVTYESSQTTQ